MKSDRFKFALTAKNANFVAFLLSQKTDIHAEDKNGMQVDQALNRHVLMLTLLF